MARATVTGAEYVAGSFLKAAASASGRAAEVTGTYVEEIAEEQRATVPVQSGQVRGSIHSDVTVESGMVRGEAGPSHFVARFLQYGTVNMPPQWDALESGDRIAEQWQQALADRAGDV